VPGYIPRFVDGVINRLIGELPGVLLVGPRATGKTTTARRFAQTVVQLDDDAVATTFALNPDSALRDLEEPVLVDEWQMVPPILAALKRTIDTDPHPGRYIVTGSVRTDLETPGWAATGRLTRVAMYGLSQREIIGKADSTFIDKIVAGNIPTVFRDCPDAKNYVEIALRSGYPDLVGDITWQTRQDWLEGYVEHILTRDAPEVGEVRNPTAIRQYLEAFALNTGGQVHDKTLASAARVHPDTGRAYQHLLQNLLVIENVSAWRSNRFQRLSQTPKRYLLDPALLSGIVRANPVTVFRDSDLLGRVLDTFIAAQLRAELSASSSRPRMYHLRDDHGRHEVDIVLELGGFQVVGIEVKAGAQPARDAARHLEWMREGLGDRFLCGIVFHTGRFATEIGDRILSLPICALWA
jgi:predicted AAA+ superfamily ATPase